MKTTIMLKADTDELKASRTPVTTKTRRTEKRVRLSSWDMICMEKAMEMLVRNGGYGVNLDSAKRLLKVIYAADRMTVAIKS